MNDLNTQLSEVHRINTYKDTRNNQWVYFIHMRFYPFRIAVFTGVGETPELAQAQAYLKARAELVRLELLPAE